MLIFINFFGRKHSKQKPQFCIQCKLFTVNQTETGTCIRSVNRVTLQPYMYNVYMYCMVCTCCKSLKQDKNILNPIRIKIAFA